MNLFPALPTEISPIPDGDAQDKLSTESLTKKQLAMESLVHEVTSKFQIAADARRPQEQIWMEDWKQFNGEPSEEEVAAIAKARARNSSASAVIVPITKTKTMAAYGQICEILFGDARFPISIEPTPIPEGIAEEISIVDEAAPDIYGYDGDGQTVEPGATYSTMLNGLKDRIGKMIGAGKKIVEGTVPDPKAIKLNPADISARLTDKLIQDQLKEQSIEAELRSVVLETCSLGTGVMKRPMTFKETIHRWVEGEDGPEYAPVEKLSPKPKFVSVWNWYPDPHARRVSDAAYCIERHKLNRHKLKALKKQPFFNKKAIDDLLAANGNYTKQWWEATNLLTNLNEPAGNSPDWEVLEYTGYLDKETLEDVDGISDKELDAYADTVPVNIWVCNRVIIRVVLNPYTVEADWYYAVPFEEHPNQIWGKSLPRNMAGSQQILNGAYRLAADNMKMAGSLMFEVNENNLSAGQDMSVYNGKIWYTNGGAPGQSIFPITTPNLGQSITQFADKVRQNADEETGQPSYSYGQYTTGQTRTASGMDMLMSAASLGVKMVIKNFDIHLLEKLGQAMFHWNMQFNTDMPEIRGDMRVLAKGTQVLTQKAVQSQRILGMMQTGANPMVAPFVNWEYLLKESAKAMSLDPEKAVNDPAQAMLYAELMGKVTNALNQGTGQETGGPNAGPSAGSPESPPGPPNATASAGTGGGDVGAGSPPQPGQGGFSG